MKQTFTLLLFISLICLLSTGCKKGEIIIGHQPFTIQSDNFKNEIPISFGDKTIIVSYGDKPGGYFIFSPQLSWKNAPTGTAQFIAVMDDNDPVKPHTWWIASISSTLSGLVEDKLNKSIIPDLIPMIFPLAKPLIPILFPDPNKGGVHNIVPFSEPNRWNTATSCTLAVYALKSIMNNADFSRLKSRSNSMDMNREKFTAFCKSSSIDILDSAKVSYSIKHI